MRMGDTWGRSGHSSFGGDVGRDQGQTDGREALVSLSH